MDIKFFNKRFWAGLVLGIVLSAGFVWVMEICNRDFGNIKLPNIMTHYEKIGECHYIFEVDTITGEVKRILYHVPGGDPESWERKNSAAARDWVPTDTTTPVE